MRVIPLPNSGRHYTSNAYLVLGTWNRLSDVNTLVDVGRDPSVIGQIRSAPTGLGKRKVDRVILTHSHYDHAEMLPAIRQEFHPEVLAYSPSVPGLDRTLVPGEAIVLGDEEFEVIAIHAHTDDSICLYNPANGVLFSGDAPVIVHSPGGEYEPEFVEALGSLCERGVREIYPGHGDPLREDCGSLLRNSLEMIRRSSRIPPTRE